jgi:hypothetical protein
VEGSGAPGLRLPSTPTIAIPARVTAAPVRSHAIIDLPEPNQGNRHIDTAIGRTDSSRRGGMKRQEPRKEGKARRGGESNHGKPFFLSQRYVR